MKKIIGVVVSLVILVVLLIGVYAGTGWLTERAFKKTVQNIQQAKGIELTVKEYGRGIFSSNAVVVGKLRVPAHQSKLANGLIQTIPEMDYLIPMHLLICHGPVILSKDGVHLGLGYARTQINVPKSYQKQMQDTFSAASSYPKIKLSLLINFLNKAKISADVPGFHMTTLVNDGQFDWTGLKSTSKIALDLSTLEGKAELAGARFHQAETTMQVGQVTSDYQINKTKLGFYEGGANFLLKSLQVDTHGKTQLGIKNFLISSNSHEQGALFDAYLKAALDAIVIENVSYGPGQVEMALKNLDAEVLARINRKIKSTNQDSIIARQKMLFALLPDLPRLVEHGAIFSISNLSFTMPEGKVQGALEVSLPEGSANNPFQILSHIIGTGHLVVPVKVVTNVMENAVRQKLQQPPVLDAQQTTNPSTPSMGLPQGTDLEQQVKTLTEKRLSSLVESGALVQQGSDYSLDVKLEQGKIMVNGKPFIPSMLEF